MNPDSMFQNSLDTKSRIDSKTSFETTSKKPNTTLGTIRMVEEVLSGTQDYPKKNKLLMALPRQIQYPSFKVILDYLEESNKLIYDDDGTIVWTFANNSKLEKLRAGESLLDQ